MHKYRQKIQLIESLANSSDVANSNLSLTAIGLFYKILSMEVGKEVTRDEVMSFGLSTYNLNLYDAINELEIAGFICFDADRGC